MVIWHLVERELRSSARQRFTYYLRVIASVLMLSAVGLFGAQSAFADPMGGQLFGALHLTLFVMIWVFVPFLTADCISREWREGTLGLLFLTRLGAGDIVLAKSFAHGLRSATLWLSVLPVLALPFLVGGVGWREAFLSACVNLSSIFLALAAGLLGSSVSRVWARILVWVACLSMVLCVCFAFVHCLVGLGCMGYLRQILAEESLVSLLGIPFLFVTDANGCWSGLLATSLTTQTQQFHWMEVAAATTLASAGVFWLVIWLAALRVRRVWREEPPSQRIQWLRSKFCESVFSPTLFRHWMQRRLRLNPVGWLEQRRWTGRLISWIWLGLVMIFGCPDSGQVAYAMAAFMGLCLSLGAAASFRRERETGVLELLLISPLGEARVISGRVRALWMQFLPGAGLLIAIWLFGYYLDFPYRSWSGDHSELEAIGFSASTFLTVPLIGLYFSLRFRGFVLALLATVITALVVPPVICELAGTLWHYCIRSTTGWYSLDIVFPSFYAIVWQFALAALAWHRLLGRLKVRRFPISD